MKVYKKVIAAIFDPKKMHVYDVKTTGKHPVHLIEGGEYITESTETFNEGGEMGWFYLNQKDYDYFKSQLKEVTIAVDVPSIPDATLEKRIDVPIFGGNIVATAYDYDEAYRGIDVEVVLDEDDDNDVIRPRVVVEQTPDGTVRVLVWKNPNDEDYTEEIILR